MPLTDDELERYSRQILVPGIGEQGQERLLDAHVVVAGHARGVAQASLYLRAAGVTVTPGADPTASSRAPGVLIVVAGADALSAEQRSGLIASGRPVCWYVLQRDGFVAGIHPQAPLPLSCPPTSEQGIPDDALHDAAACDAAAAACALIAGLAPPGGPFSCPLE